MESINIAKVSCRVDKLATLTYEQLYDSAINAMAWKGVKDAKALIDKELREHGFKPSKTNRKPIKADNTVKGGKSAKRGNTRKRSTNRKSSKK